MDILADSGLVVASIVQEVIVCFSFTVAYTDIVFILIAVVTSILASRYVLDWFLL